MNLEMLQKENQQLKTVLKFYAEANYSEFGCGCCGNYVKDGIVEDEGTLARKALEGELLR